MPLDLVAGVYFSWKWCIAIWIYIVSIIEKDMLLVHT
jgi:hypothetical protein